MQKKKRARAADWSKGKCYTYKGACRVFWSFDDVKREAGRERVRSFDTETDAKQWLFAMSFCGV